jgi:hypothetical protein
MKKEITIKDTIKEILYQNFKGTKYSKFNEYHLNKEIKSDEYVIYTYEISNYCYIRVHHNLELKEIEFRLWNEFNLLQKHSIQYL